MMGKLFVLCAAVLGSGSLLAGEEKERESGKEAQPALEFEKRGAGKREVILIPGLGCGGEVWRGTAEGLEKDYTLYILTLAGFAGVSPLEAPYCEKWVEGIARLIEKEKLEKPILVGHSLGGNLALRLAIRRPELAGGVVAVDGMPIFPPLGKNETIEQRRQRADFIAQALRAGTAEQFAAQVKMSLGMLVSAEEDAEKVAAMCLASDRGTYSGAMRELMTTDLRPDLGKVRAPVAVIVPVYADGTFGKKSGEWHESAEKTYREAYEGAPKLSLEFIPDSRHFAMYDQPEKFREALLKVLARLEKPSRE